MGRGEERILIEAACGGLAGSVVGTRVVRVFRESTVECRAFTLPASRGTRCAFRGRGSAARLRRECKTSRTAARKMVNGRGGRKTTFRSGCAHAPGDPGSRHPCLTGRLRSAPGRTRAFRGPAPAAPGRALGSFGLAREGK